ncbi:MAG: hypothetical protein NT069_08040, partial [Planctomycetota bacterium]|nr:hypothetical protein [Planctomycetota bacterium]
MKRRIGNVGSHDAEVKQQVTFTDLTAGCAVGRDAAGASSRHVANGVPTTAGIGSFSPFSERT